MIIGTLAGCNQNTSVDIHTPEEPATLYDEGEMDLADEMVPLTESPAMFAVAMPMASGTSVRKNAKAEIDHSNVKDGYVMIR